MATIIQTPAGKWQAVIRRKGNKPIKRNFSRKTDATNWAKLTESDIERGEYRPIKKGEKLTFTELVELFSTDTDATGKAFTLATLSPGQQRTAPGVLRYWREQFGHLRLKDINRETIEDAITALSQRRKLSSTGRDMGIISPSTTRKYISILGTVYKYAISKRIVDQSPLQHIEKPTANDERTRYLSQKEYAALKDALELSACKELKPIILMAIHTGWRKSELLCLTWGHTNLSNTAKPYQTGNKPFLIPPYSILIETSKNKDPRTVALTGDTLEALTSFQQAVINELEQAGKPAPNDSNLLFPSRENPRKPLDVRTPWKTTLHRAGLDNFRWHDLRHTFASWAIMSNSNLIEVARVTGHRDLKSLQRYSHLAPEHTADVVTRMTKRIEGLK